MSGAASADGIIWVGTGSVPLVIQSVPQESRRSGLRTPEAQRSRGLQRRRPLTAAAAIVLMACARRPGGTTTSATTAPSLATTVNCPLNEELAKQAQAAFDGGRLIRGRTLVKRARHNCPGQVDSGLERRIQTALESHLSPEQLLESAAAARKSGNQTAARRTASQAIRALVVKLGEGLETTFKSWIGPLYDHAWSQDGKRIIVSSSSTAVVFDTQSGQELLRVSAPSGRYIGEGGFSPDGHWLVLNGGALPASDAQLDIYDLGAHIGPRHLSAVTVGRQSWVFSKDSQTLAWLEPRGTGADPAVTLRAVDVSSMESRFTVEIPHSGSKDPSGSFEGLVQSPDGQLIAVIRDGQVTLVHFADGESLHFDQIPEGSEVAFSASGAHAAWLARGGVALWDRGSTAPRILRDPRCKPHVSPIVEMGRGVFSPSESLLATPANFRACLWDVAKGRLAAVLPSANSLPENEQLCGPFAWV